MKLFVRKMFALFNRKTVSGAVGSLTQIERNLRAVAEYQDAEAARFQDILDDAKAKRQAAWDESDNAQIIADRIAKLVNIPAL